MKKTRAIFLNGEIVFAVEALRKSLAPGRLKGKGVFETLRVYNGKIFALAPHVRRLNAGLKKIKVVCPFSRPAIKRYFYQIVRLNKHPNTRVRLTVWSEAGKSRMAIVAYPYRPYSTSKYQKGFKACLADERLPFRRGYHNVKSIQYAAFARARQNAARKGCDEAILVNRKNELVEGSRSNIFIVKNRRLLTPAFVSGCLNGITRQIIFKLAKKIGLRVRPMNLSPQDIVQADEVFLTNSLMEIMPLTVWQGRPIAQGKPGPFTERLMREYKKLREAA